MSFFKDVSLVRAPGDLWTFLRQSPRERVVPAVLAILLPAVMVFVFIIDSRINTAPPYKDPEIIYVESWPASRTREEILADRLAIQAEKDALAKAEVERRKAAFRALGRASGMDVKQLECEADNNCPK
jgi:hypothetical protein